MSVAYQRIDPPRRTPVRLTAVPPEGEDVVMTHDERIAIGDRVWREYQLLNDFLRYVTVVISLLPVGYGVLTWIFGDALWGTSPVYRAALQVPYAPESWGASFITLGSMLLYCVWREHHRLTAIAATLVAVALSMFMCAFFIEAADNTTLSALPPAMIYGIFSLLFLGRARHAYASRTCPGLYRRTARRAVWARMPWVRD